MYFNETATDAIEQRYLDCLILHPGLLGRIGDTAFAWKIYPRIGSKGNIMHFSQQRHEHRRLPRASGTDDQVETTLLEGEFVFNAQPEGPAAGWCAGAIVLLPGPCKFRPSYPDVILVRF